MTLTAQRNITVWGKNGDGSATNNGRDTYLVTDTDVDSGQTQYSQATTAYHPYKPNGHSTGPQL